MVHQDTITEIITMSDSLLSLFNKAKANTVICQSDMSKWQNILETSSAIIDKLMLYKNLLVQKQQTYQFYHSRQQMYQRLPSCSQEHYLWQVILSDARQDYVVLQNNCLDIKQEINTLITQLNVFLKEDTFLLLV